MHPPKDEPRKALLFAEQYPYVLSLSVERFPFSTDCWRGPQEVSVLQGVDSASVTFVNPKRHEAMVYRVLSVKTTVRNPRPKQCSMQTHK
jgi:hypothetical protein